MSVEQEGAGRQGEPTPSQAGRPEQTQAPHQRGEGIRGVPPPQGGQAEPQPEHETRHRTITFRIANGKVFEIAFPPSVSAAHSPSSEEKPHKSTPSDQRTEQPKAVYNCVLPPITIPPVHLRAMVRNGILTEEQVQEEEKIWREKIKTWDKQELEEEIQEGEEDLQEWSEDESEFTAGRKREGIQDREYQLAVLREELRRRQTE